MGGNTCWQWASYHGYICVSVWRKQSEVHCDATDRDGCTECRTTQHSMANNSWLMVETDKWKRSIFCETQRSCVQNPFPSIVFLLFSEIISTQLECDKMGERSHSSLNSPLLHNSAAGVPCGYFLMPTGGSRAQWDTLSRGDRDRLIPTRNRVDSGANFPIHPVGNHITNNMA